MSLNHLLKRCLLKIQPFGNFYRSYKDMEKTLASCLSIEQQNSQLLSEQAVILETYQNKLSELSEYRRKTQEEHFLLFFSEWWSWGATDSLLHMYKMLERHTTYWEMEWPALWVVYLCCLLEKNEQAHARDVLQKIVDQFGAGALICYLPAAKFAYDLGIAAGNPEIERSAKIFKTMSARLRQDSFYSYLQGKSIAIVGNSDCELNRSLGSAIDKHDVVIRFNNYFHAKPVVDYGQKTTVWVRNGQPEPAIPNLSINPEASSQYKFVLYADDYFHTFVSAELLPAMEIDFKSTRYQAVSFSAEIHQELRQRANLANPTSGAYVIWYLYRLFGTLENIDFYGFSFLNDTFKRDDCHGNEIFNWHEMSTENEFLKSLISKHPTKERVDL